MFVEGVLRSQKGGPIYQGLALYKLLNENNKVILLCENKTKDDIWLRQHKINKLDDLVIYLKKAEEGSELAKFRDILKNLKNRTARVINQKK